MILSKVNLKVSPFENAETTTNSKLARRWGGHHGLFDQPEGWVGVPDSFLRHFAKGTFFGGLTNGQAMFILQLMTFKWTERAPYPSYGKIAARMGISDKMVRRYAAELELKGCIKRNSRVGSTNAFDMTPLFDALQQAVERDNSLAKAS